MILLFTFSSKTFANFQLSPGVNTVLPFKSSEVNSLNLPYFKANSGLGLELNMQINLPLALSLNLDGAYSGGSAKAQYDYTAPATGQVKVADLKTDFTYYTGAASFRYHLINFEQFKIYGGYGILVGTLSLSHSYSDFENKHGSTTGLYQFEDSGFVSQFFEAGVEYFWSKTDALQLTGKSYKIETGGFSTLNSSRVSASIGQIALLYNHVVNWDFFWR